MVAPYTDYAMKYVNIETDQGLYIIQYFTTKKFETLLTGKYLGVTLSTVLGVSHSAKPLG